MQKYIFNSLDGIDPNKLYQVFNNLWFDERARNYETCKSDYEWLIGYDVWNRMLDTYRSHFNNYPFDIKSYKFMGIDIKILAPGNRPTTIILERKEPKNEKKVLVGDLTTGYHYVSCDEASKYEEEKDVEKFEQAYIIGLLPKTSALVRKYILRITTDPHNIFEGGVTVRFTRNRRKFGHTFAHGYLESINWDWKLIDKELCCTINRYTFEMDSEYLLKMKERLDAMYELNSKIKVKVKDITVKKGVTTLVWSDGDVTMVSCGVEDDFDLEKGIAMAVAKKFLGTNKSKSNFNDEIHRLMDIAEAKYVNRQE